MVLAKSHLAVLTLLALSATAAPYGNDDDDDGPIGDDHDADGGDDDGASSEARGTSSVYVMEHSFLTAEAPNWLPRGTLLLSGAVGRDFEARLSDAKEFVQLRPELQPMMNVAAEEAQYYAIRMYSPEKPRRVLQASIPAKMMVDHFEDWHDILEVTVGASGVPVSLNCRVRHTLGLSLFDHTQVHLAEPSRTEGPRVAAVTRDATGAATPLNEKGQQPPQSFLRKYWWVALIVMLLVSNLTADPAAPSGGKGSGGGGGKASRG